MLSRYSRRAPKASFSCQAVLLVQQTSHPGFPANLCRQILPQGRPLRAVREHPVTHSVKSGLYLQTVTIATVFFLIGCSFAFRWSSEPGGIHSPQGKSGQRLTPPPHTVRLVSSEQAVVTDNMVMPPGRLGNLTPEQEAKLREFWVAVLQVFGVVSDEELEEVNGRVLPDAGGHEANSEGMSTPDGQIKPKNPGTQKKRKKHLGLFGKKSHKDPESQSSADADTTSSSASVGDFDDKYGQNKQFKQALASQTPEDLRTAFWSMVKHDNPDGLLLRFLRARKWDVQKALVMLVTTMHWRSQEMHVDDDVIKAGEAGAVEASQSSDPATRKEGEDFLAQLRMGKSYLHGVDKEGRPMCFVRVRLHKQGEQSEASLERYTVYIIETARLLLTGPVDTAVC